MNPINQMVKSFCQFKRRKATLKQNLIFLDLKSLEISDRLHPFFLDPTDEGLSVDLKTWGFREPLNTSFLSKFIREQNITQIIDVGSNIGYFPVVEHASGAKKIVALEPVPSTNFWCRVNTKLFPGITVLSKAVTTENQTVTMYVPTWKNMASVTLESAQKNVIKRGLRYVKVIQVPSVTLEKIIQDFNLRHVLVRMDVEGYEEKLLEKLPSQVKYLSFELHPYILGIKRAIQVIESLKRQGFTVTLLIRDTTGISPLIKTFKLSMALKLFEGLGEKRVFQTPDHKTIRRIIMDMKECPHVYAEREVKVYG